MGRRITPASSSNTLTATGTLVEVDFGGKAPRTVRGYVKAASVTTGGTVQLQASADGTNYANAATAATVNADGAWAIVADGPARYWRLQLTARTDGTFSDSYIEALT